VSGAGPEGTGWAETGNLDIKNHKYKRKGVTETGRKKGSLAEAAHIFDVAVRLNFSGIQPDLNQPGTVILNLPEVAIEHIVKY